MKDDLFNLTLTTSIEEVDDINKKFYGRYNFPWPPRMFPSFPSGIGHHFLNQDMGYWNTPRIPENAKIWVAGCGTNQAVFTALRYPDATVIGTDISSNSIKTARKTAHEIGITNLQMEEMSLNEVTYDADFDYIICTGVVHHNANPESTLCNIAKALKPDGILEFMVYNYYHRLMTTACQRAVRTFYDGNSIDMNFELETVKEIIKAVPPTNLMGNYLRAYETAPEPMLADSLLQPVEYSYTVESLGQLFDHCNLEYMSYCVNQFDTVQGSVKWNMPFTDSLLAEKYYRLPDEKRWQITNLLMLNESPMLWFYVQHKDSNFARMSEQEICNTFLETSFARNSFPVKNYMINIKGGYTPTGKIDYYPLKEKPEDDFVRQVWEAVVPEKTMKEVLDGLHVSLPFYQLNDLRIKLTTLAFPYLKAVK